MREDMEDKKTTESPERSPSGRTACSADSLFDRSSEIRQMITRLAAEPQSPRLRALALRQIAEAAIFSMRSRSDVNDLQQLFGYVVGSIADALLASDDK